MQQQGGAKLAVHVATLEDIGQEAVGNAVEQISGKGQLAGFVDTDHNAGDALFFRASAFNVKLH
ncbi:hypothetical protein D3C86_2017970 [compost metagenome]